MARAHESVFHKYRQLPANVYSDLVSAQAVLVFVWNHQYVAQARSRVSKCPCESVIKMDSLRASDLSPVGALSSICSSTLFTTIGKHMTISFILLCSQCNNYFRGTMPSSIRDVAVSMNDSWQEIKVIPSSVLMRVLSNSARC